MNLLKEGLNKIKSNIATKRQENNDTKKLDNIFKQDISLVDKIKLLISQDNGELSHLYLLNNLSDEDIDTVIKSGLSNVAKTVILINNGKFEQVSENQSLIAEMGHNGVDMETIYMYAIYIADIKESDENAYFQFAKSTKITTLQLDNLVSRKTETIVKLMANEKFKYNIMKLIKYWNLHENLLDYAKLSKILEVYPEVIKYYSASSMNTYKKILKNKELLKYILNKEALQVVFNVPSYTISGINWKKPFGNPKGLNGRIFAFEFIDEFKEEYIELFSRLDLIEAFAQDLSGDEVIKKFLGPKANIYDDKVLVSYKFFNHFFRNIEASVRAECILKFAHTSFENRKLMLNLIFKNEYISYRKQALMVLNKLNLDDKSFFNALGLVVYYPELTLEILNKEKLLDDEVSVIKYLSSMPVLKVKPQSIREIKTNINQELQTGGTHQKNKLPVSPTSNRDNTYFNEYTASVMFIEDDGDIKTYSADEIHHSDILEEYIRNKYHYDVDNVSEASIKLSALGMIVMITEGTKMILYIPQVLSDNQIKSLREYLAGIKETNKVGFSAMLIKNTTETDISKISGDFDSGFQLNNGDDMSLEQIYNFVENTFEFKETESRKR